MCTVDTENAVNSVVLMSVVGESKFAYLYGWKINKNFIGYTVSCPMIYILLDSTNTNDDMTEKYGFKRDKQWVLMSDLVSLE